MYISPEHLVKSGILIENDTRHQVNDIQYKVFHLISTLDNLNYSIGWI